jgi:hypothetical protein
MPGPDLVERQLLGDGGKQLLHVLGRLGRRLKEEQPGLLRVGLGVGGGNSPLVGLLRYQVQLVPGEGDDDVLVGLPLQLLDPGFGLIQGCLILTSARGPERTENGNIRLG